MSYDAKISISGNAASDLEFALRTIRANNRIPEIVRNALCGDMAAMQIVASDKQLSHVLAEVSDPKIAGEKYALNIGVGDVHINRPIENFARGFESQQHKFIGDKVAPIIPVDRLSNNIWRIAPIFSQPTLLEGSIDGNPSEMVLNPPTTATYTCVPRGLRVAIPGVVELNMDSPLTVQTLYVTPALEAFNLAREYRVGTAVFNTANYVSPTDLTAAKWSLSTATPIAQLREKVDTMAIRPNTLVLSLDTYHTIVKSAEFKSYVTNRAASDMGATPLIGNEQIIGAMIGIPNVHVGRARYSTAGTGVTQNAAGLCWANGYAALLYLEAPRMFSTLSLGTFRLGNAVRIKYMPQLERGYEGGTLVQVHSYDDLKWLDTEGYASHLFYNCV